MGETTHKRFSGRLPVTYAQTEFCYAPKGVRLFPSKRCGRLLGESRPREPGLGTGRGGDVTGLANSFSFVSARGRSRRRRAGFTERDPQVGVCLRLPLDETVTGVRPGQNLIVLVIEDV